jgi:hypothetical protein
MLSDNLINMVVNSFTKYGEFVPQEHTTALVGACRSLIPDPNKSAIEQLDHIALNYGASSMVTNYWAAQQKLAESKYKTEFANASLRVREEAKATSIKLTNDAVISRVTLDKTVVECQNTMDIVSELANVSKTVGASVRLRHEGLVEGARSERHENRLVGQ